MRISVKGWFSGSFFLFVFVLPVSYLSFVESNYLKRLYVKQDSQLIHLGRVTQGSRECQHRSTFKLLMYLPLISQFSIIIIILQWMSSRTFSIIDETAVMVMLVQTRWARAPGRTGVLPSRNHRQALSSGQHRRRRKGFFCCINVYKYDSKKKKKYYYNLSTENKQVAIK